MHPIVPRILLLLGIAAGPVELRAQAPEGDYLTHSWGAEDGLPQNTVNAMARTPDGYLWVATRGGLARFDGVRFTRYGLDAGLKGLAIMDLTGDGEGGLWIGTLGGGLGHWRDGKITSLTTADGLAHNDVMALAPAGPGAVWVGTKNGLQRRGPNGFSPIIGGSAGLDREVVTLEADGVGGVWASFEVTGLFHCRLDGYEEIPGPPAYEHFHGHSLLRDRKGDLWVGIGNGILLCRRGDAWAEYNPTHGLPLPFISELAETESGEIWAGTAGEGLWVLRDGRFQAVPGAGSAIRSMLMDDDGLIWAGTTMNGLSLLSPRKLKHHPVGTVDRRGPSNGLMEAPAGTLWVTTYGGGLFRGPRDRLEPVAVPAELEGYRYMTTALTLKDGSVVIGGPRIFLEQPTPDAAIRGFIHDENITALCEAADGSLLVGTREGLVKRRVGDGFEALDDPGYPAGITALVRGPGDALWIATQGAGLFRRKDGKTEHWGTAEGLPTGVLRGLFAEQDGTLWIGTLGGGLAWWRDGRIHSAGPQQGLNDDVVTQILDDRQGNLWIGGHRGIQRVAKQELHELETGRATRVHPLVLDESDGMSIAECTGGYSPSGYRSAAGILHFATLQGVVAIDPADFGPAVKAPPVIIESLTLNGLPQEIRRGEIELPAGPRDVEIHFTAFNFVKPDHIRFRYRMNGGPDWVESQGDRAVRFSQLPPGRHEFVVSAANSDGRWNPAAASLNFTVLPHYWQTGWFRIGAALALVIAGAALAWNRARLHLRHAAERERMLVAESDARRHLSELTHVNRVSTLGGLSTALAHELNQPLAAIHSNAEAADIFLSAEQPDLTELREILSDIRADGHRAGEVIHRMRALLRHHLFKTERIEVADLLERTAGLLQAIVHSRKAKLSLDLAPELPEIQGDAVHLQQLLLNLTLNALEAMTEVPPEKREVVLRAVRREPGMVEFSVIDRGPGIPAAKLLNLAEPFVTTKKDGMGMGLAICHSIVSTHGGCLSAENPAEGGAIVRFTLPVAGGRG